MSVGLFPGDNTISQDTDILDLALHDVADFQIPRLRISAESRDSGHGPGGHHISRTVTHGRVVGEDFRDFHRHLAGVGSLARFTIYAQFHRKIVRIGNFIGSDDPWSERTKSINSLTKAEHSGFHLATLNIARGDVVEDHIAADMIVRLFGSEVLAASFQHDSQFELVIQFLGEVLRIDHGFFVTDDRVHILKEDDPGHHRVRKARLGGLLMVLTEISRGMKKLFRDDRRPKEYVLGSVKDSLASRTGHPIIVMQGVVERLVRGLKAGVSALEERPHVRGNQGIGQAVIRVFAFDITQVKCAGAVEVNDASIIGHRTDAGLPGPIFEGNESHKVC